VATNFPTSLDALTNPTGSDALTSPDHAGQHANSNDAIEALQAKVGVNGSAVVTSLDYKVGLLSAVGASSLTGTIASFNQERSGSVTAGQKYANGNGSANTYICFPAACKLVAATISASTDINGTAVVRPWLNAAVVGVSTYDMTVSIASPVVSYDFYASPLAIPANQRFAWNCQSSTVTVGTTSITFYVKFD
jgi:hypothetical protein